MPMYEKGSVRAEPRSKQQERMKKIMKKFLSSLLALTMILSLVIVPAQAHGTTYSVSGDVAIKNGSSTVSSSLSLAAGDTVTLKADTSGLKLQQSVDGATATDVEGTVTPSYSWTVTDSNNVVTEDATNAETITLTAADVTGSATVKCRVTLTASDSASASKDSSEITVNVKSKQSAFEDALKTAKVTFKDRPYAITNDWATTVKYFEGEATDLADETKYNCTLTGSKVSLSEDGKKLTVYNSDKSCSKEITLRTEKAVTTKPNITAEYGAGLNSTREGQKTKLSVTYNAVTSSPVTYKWYFNSQPKANSNKSTYDCSEISDGTYIVTVEIYEGGTLAVTSNEFNLTVNKDPYQNKVTAKSGYETSMVANQVQSLQIYIADQASGTDYTVVWNSSKTDVATISGSGVGNKVGVLTALNKTGSTKVTATVTYQNKDYSVAFDTISVKAADTKFGSIKNGGSDYYTDDQLEDMVVSAINKISTTTYNVGDVESIKIKTLPSHVTLYGDEIKSTKALRANADLTTYDRVYYAADKGYIDVDGDNTQLIVEVKLKGAGTPTVTISIPVSADNEIKETVTGTSANKSVTFTNSDYDSLYIYEGSSFKTEKYDGDWSRASGHTDWKLVSKNKDYTVSSNAFSSGKATLYVVAVDDGIASTGTITVTQKSYDITYNVVAGKSVTFDQKAFDSFLADIAEDDGKYNPKKDDISFDHAVLTSSVPSAKNEGTLYYGSTEITSSNRSKTEMTDMDKVSFDTVSKPKDTITLTFRVYGEVEKPNSRKADKVDYSVNVVISVVKEDITYTVGIDDTVQLTARDFVNFLQDAKTSYRKAELDYVKFDVSGKNVSSYAYGGLYRSYSSYSTGKLADSTDKFYYEPSRTQYDLADVAYHTTRWAEAGKTVYIPFTVYGTKNEEASGTMAITIAQTMNFIDVKPGDFFYEPVKWAVNNKITNGTSSTTFSPYKNCNRAEIVTFLWRAAGSPEPTVTRNPFTDVNSVRDASYYKAILWASQKGITAGTNATTFSPYQECTRSQIVTFLYRYAGKPSGYYSNPFKDVSSVNEASYYNAILWAVGKGITQGTSTTTFSPYASCTRGEAVTFLYRYVNGVK